MLIACFVILQVSMCYQQQGTARSR